MQLNYVMKQRLPETPNRAVMFSLLILCENGIYISLSYFSCGTIVFLRRVSLLQIESFVGLNLSWIVEHLMFDVASHTLLSLNKYGEVG
jgi:hypothetical protein